MAIPFFTFMVDSALDSSGNGMMRPIEVWECALSQWIGRVMAFHLRMRVARRTTLPTTWLSCWTISDMAL